MNGSNDDSEGFDSIEELLALLLSFGVSVSDACMMTFGSAVNLLLECSRLDKIKRGVPVTDPDKQYRQLKAIEPIVDEKYLRGEISEAKYRGFKASLERWENDVEDY